MNQLNSKQNSLRPQQRKRTLQEEFVHHCAVAIQSKFRGYIQRKRYKAFLPIYRRVRELLYALASGWKIRKIMKLQPIKNQISDVRLKMKNGQVNAARIAKRELGGEIERLFKKGRWIEVLFRFRTMKSKVSLNGKENSSLYANIKSKSIKNIFKDQVCIKNDLSQPKASTKEPKKDVVTQLLVKESPKMIERYAQYQDDRPIKGMKSVSNCETEIKPVQVIKERSFHKKDSHKRQQKDAISKEVPKTTRMKKPAPKQVQSESLKKQPQQEIISQQISTNDMMKSSQVSKSSHGSKKIKVTLATNLISSVQSNQSFKIINESTIDMKAQETLKASQKSLVFSKREESLEVVQVYREKYLQQKAKIIEKLGGLDFRYTPTVGKDIKKCLDKY